MYLFSEMNVFIVLLLLFLWGLGGWLVILRLRLAAHEQALIGLGVGLTVSALLANFLARWLPTEAAFWAAGILPVLIGLAVSRKALQELVTRQAWDPVFWLAFLLAVFFFTLIGRGLGLFDDYQNLPQVSSMALGDIPPHFVYDPGLLWSYHYFLLLVAAMFTRLAGAAPWVSLDLARGLALGLTLVYAGFFSYRLAKNHLVAAFSVMLLFFAGGARWILLLLPSSVLDMVSASVQMIGSGADTAARLEDALYNNWQVQGLGPFPFPFIYGSGLDPSLTMAHAGYGASAVMLVLLIVLVAQHGKGVLAQALLAVLLAALALANEVTFIFLYGGLAFAALGWMLIHRSWQLPASLWAWFPAWGIGGLLSLLQGGVLSGMAVGLINRVAGTAAADPLYQVSFSFRFPAVLSAHTGTLWFAEPLHWIVILAELGLVIFALPWVARYAITRVQKEDWFSAALLLSMIPSLLTIFMEYTGNAGPTALSRMTAHFLLIIKIYAVSLLWGWVREQDGRLQAALVAWGAAAMLSGISLLGLQIPGMANPNGGEFISSLDVQMNQKHWGTLQSNALVFDTSPPRGTTVLGLHTYSGINYGPPTYETWYQVSENPSPAAFLAAGYRYLYLDLEYWRQFEDHFRDDCIEVIDTLQFTANDGRLLDQRILLDVGACVE